jgi:hypothetical protein
VAGRAAARPGAGIPPRSRRDPAEISSAIHEDFRKFAFDEVRRRE